MGEFALRMENEMSIRGFSDGTKKSYLLCMKSFIRYCRKAPDELSLEDVNRFQIFLAKEKQAAFSTFNQHVCAIIFFYKHVLKKTWDIKQIPYQKREKRLPRILNRKEILRVIVNCCG
jgi:site-specific recombinase XerD